jgi:hypothetical protein
MGDFQREIFLKRWAKSIDRSNTIIYDEARYYNEEFIIPFRNKKHTIGDRILSRNILNWCLDNGIECHQIDFESDYDDSEYNALQIIFNF